MKELDIPAEDVVSTTKDLQGNKTFKSEDDGHYQNEAK